MYFAVYKTLCVLLLTEPIWVVKELTEVLTREENSFYSLSKRGKGPGAQSGIGPEGWLVESFIEFKGQGTRKRGVSSYLF